MKKIFLTFFTVACVTSIAFGNTNNNNSICADSIWTVSSNPFASSTNITLYNLTSDTITLKIYDRWGNIIKEFFNNVVVSGTITVTFNADTLPEGGYPTFFGKNQQGCVKNLIKTVTAGTSDYQTDKFQLETYPNPTHSELNIVINDNKTYIVSIKNILGQTLAEKSFFGKISFDISTWARGMLFVELRDEKGLRVRMEKVIVE